MSIDDDDEDNDVAGMIDELLSRTFSFRYIYFLFIYFWTNIFTSIQNRYFSSKTLFTTTFFCCCCCIGSFENFSFILLYLFRKFWFQIFWIIFFILYFIFGSTFTRFLCSSVHVFLFILHLKFWTEMRENCLFTDQKVKQ